METYKIYSGGTFIETSETIEVKNPYSNSTFAITFLAGKKELDHSIEKALSVKEEMRNLPTYKKFQILHEIADKLIEAKSDFAQVLSLESGKPIKYALGEIERAIQVFRIAAEESKRLPKEYFSVDWTSSGENKEGLVKYFPLGLIAGIAPFNFPLNLAVHKIAPAIASGNVMILKPARTTPLSTLKLAQIIDQTELPKGALSILPMDRVAGNQLVTDERIQMLTFTGSPEVGWKMKSDAGKKKIALELGGNAGVIITDTANLELAVQKCLVGSFAYSGQVCIHTQRIYVHKNILDEFVNQLKVLTETLKFGDPLDADTDISTMIDKNNALRVEEWIQEAVNSGAKLICGGKRHKNYIEPTILTNTLKTMKVCACEVFGPVVVIEPFENFQDAIEMINDTEFGLQAGVFTNKIDEMNIAFDQIEAGGVIINDVPTFRVDHMPYGGIKNSGFGREGIKYTILEMLEPKLLIKSF